MSAKRPPAKPPPGPPPVANHRPGKRPAPIALPPCANITPRRTSPRLCKEGSTPHGGGFLTPTLSMLSGQLSGLNTSQIAAFGCKAAEPSPGLLESGDARGQLLDVVSAPCEYARKWQRCIMVRQNKTEYRLFLEDTDLDSQHFVLSAVRDLETGTFYISHYQDFPSLPKEARQSHHCAVLQCPKPKSFKLYSCSCEGCDRVLGKYTCGSCRPGVPEQYRQLLASITHEKQKIPKTASEAHWMKAELPALVESDDWNAPSRHVWCPRVASYDEQGRVRATPNEEKLMMESALPVWNAARGSLSLKFAEGRVKKASAKNFSLLHGAGDDRKAVLQYGKCKKSTFVMDVRRPMSLVQAFGISLSVADWKP